MAMIPELELVMTLHVEIAPPLEIGDIGGIRRVIPIVGGRIEGRNVRGQVLVGGADWTLARHDGTSELRAAYTVRTDDDVIIGIHNTGIAVPQFEVAGERYAWLRRSIFVGILESVSTADAVQLQFFRVT